MGQNKLWTKNFTLIIFSTTLGCIGGIAGRFALSFLVYEETSSTLAAALVAAIRLIPGFFIPLFISPIMDRLPRKPFLVGGDAVAALLYLLGGLWLKANEFSYIPYLVFSLMLSCIGSFDELSYNALYPKLITPGMEEKGYSASSMLYPMLNIVMMPLSAILYKTVGAANILLGQSVLSLAAALTESRIRIHEEIREGTRFSFCQWWGDIKEAGAYLKREKGLLAMTIYSSTSNGMYEGYEAVMVAFFSSMPGFTITMYSFFSVVECIGRTIGGFLMYKRQPPKEKKYGFALFVYLSYEAMDACILWLPYPLMLVNRTICGFLGVQSGTIRYAATQKYIPDRMRARINAFTSILYLVFSAVLSVAIGALGEIMDLRLVMTVSAAVTFAVCILTIVRKKKDVERIYLHELPQEEIKA